MQQKTTQAPTATAILTKINGDAVKDLRKSAGKNQYEFWSPLGVTQSGGSRYESGRAIPRPVKKLIAIMYGPGLTEAQRTAAERA